MRDMNQLVVYRSERPVVMPHSGSPMRRSLIYLGYIILSIVSIVYAKIADRHFLGDQRFDGFTSQVQYIWNYWNGNNSLIDLDPLLWIHVIRALIAYVFVSIEEIGGGALVAFVIVAMTLPILNIFSRLKKGYLILSLPLLGMAVSFRTFLVVISVAYLVLFIRNVRSKWFLVVSFILSNLSSGAVMNNLIVSSTIVRNHRPTSFGLHIYITLLTISFVISALDKYQGFSEQRPGYDSTVFGASGIEAIISRSTIFVSAMEGDYSRLVAYSLGAIVALALFVFAARNEHYRGYVAILLSVIPSLIFEGLGFMSLFVPILLFLAGEHLPWRPEKKVVSGR